MLIAARLQRKCNAAGDLNDTSEGTRSEEKAMPLPDQGVFTPEQKSEMIHQPTETMVRIEGENLRPVTWVIVDEVNSGDWGIGGKGLYDRGCPRSSGEGSGRRPGLASDRDTAGAAARVSSHRGRWAHLAVVPVLTATAGHRATGPGR
jgi:4-oxalocrotonate tautomerase